MTDTTLSPSPSRAAQAAIGAVYFALLAQAYLWSALPRTLEGLGWGGALIGGVYTGRKLVEAIMMPVWARVADRPEAASSMARRLIQGQLLWGLVTISALPWLSSWWAIAAALWLYALGVGGALPLVDALALRVAGASRFGRLRSAGSVGFGVMALGMSALGASSGYAALAWWAPRLMIGVLAVALAASLCLPRAPVSTTPRSLGALSALMRRPAVVWLMVLGVVHWMGQAPYNLFFIALCESREVAAWVPGLAVGLGVVAEVTLMTLAHRLLHRWTPEQLMVVVVTTTAARWAITATATSSAVLLAAQALHGLSFGLFLPCAVAILVREIPDALRATGQATFYLAVFSLGGMLGNAGAGLLLDVASPAAAFAAAGVLDLLLIAPAILAARRLR